MKRAIYIKGIFVAATIITASAASAQFLPFGSPPAFTPSQGGFWTPPTPAQTAPVQHQKPIHLYHSRGFQNSTGTSTSPAQYYPQEPSSQRASPGIGMPNAELQTALSCAQASKGNPQLTAACTAGKLTVSEISKCASGIGTPTGCFGPNNTLVQIAKNGVNDLRNGPGDNNDLVKVFGKKPVEEAFKRIGGLFGF